jgi:hypothetical protein
MGEQLLFDNFFIPIGVWLLLYISDYCLTIWGARLYLSGGNAHMQFGGSYELTPAFQKDVDALRLISPRFVLAWLGSLLLLLIVRGLARDLPFLFVGFAGGLIMMEVFVHLRHVRNIASFRLMRRGEGVSGKIEFERWYTLRLSAADAFAFGLFCGGAAALTGSWFLAGGLVTCLGVGVRHWSASARLRQAGARDS